MLITVDTLAATLIGVRTIRGAARHYYTVADYPDLLLVTFDQDLAWYVGRQAVALVDTTTTDSTIVCDVLPDAPSHWRDTRLWQVTLKRPAALRDVPPPGPTATLTALLTRFAPREGDEP